MTPSCTRIALLVAVLGMASPAPPAAADDRADLEGYVYDMDGQPLAEVLVTAIREGRESARNRQSNADGWYLITHLRPGDYKLSFERDGYRREVLTGVHLTIGDKTNLAPPVKMKSLPDREAGHGAGAGDAVPASRGAVGPARALPGFDHGAAPAAPPDTEARESVRPQPSMITFSKEIGESLIEEEFQALPTQNRSALLFAALLPGVVPAPGTHSTSSDTLLISGQDENNNLFFMDGAANNDLTRGSQDGAKVRTPLEAIQEFQVLTAQFDAEYGRTTGGVLNAVTKSGGDRFRGVAFAYQQRAALNEPNFFVKRDAERRQPDTEFRSVGFTLGGPIKKRRAYFFLSREDNLDREGHSVSFPEGGPPAFSTTEENRIENSLVKLDLHLAAGHDLSLRYLREFSPQRNQIVPVNMRPVTLDGRQAEDDTDSNWIATLDSEIGGKSFNILRVSSTTERLFNGSEGFVSGGGTFSAQAQLPPQEIFGPPRGGYVLGPATTAFTSVDRALQIEDAFSVQASAGGSHDLRFGVQYSRVEAEADRSGLANGLYRNLDKPFSPDDETTYPKNFEIRVRGPQQARLENETLGIFVQDEWRIARGAIVSLGLRYDNESITNDPNIAPRVGFAVDPFGTGTTVVRTGFGRFYDRFPLGLFGFFSDRPITAHTGLLVKLEETQKETPIKDIIREERPENLTKLRDLLRLAIEATTGMIINPKPFVDQPDRKQPYVDTITLGLEHEFRAGYAARVDLLHSKLRNALLQVDLNPQSREPTPDRPNISILNSAPMPPDSHPGPISTWVNAGSNDHSEVQLSLRKSVRKRFGGRISYTFAESNGNVEGGARGGITPTVAIFQRRTETGYDFDRGVIIGEPPDLGLDSPESQGIPLRWHRAHNLAVSGLYHVPGTGWREKGGLVLSWVYRYMRGARATLTGKELVDGSGVARPLEAGRYDPNEDSDIGRYGTHFNGKLQGAEEPDFSRLDLSLRYRLPLGGQRTLTLVADVFNVTDEVNFEGLGGERKESAAGPIREFLIPSAVFNPREFQFGLRFEF